MQKSVENFLKFLAEDKDFSDNTLAAYNNDLTQFKQFLQGENLVEVDEPGANGTENQQIVSVAKRSRGKRRQDTEEKSNGESRNGSASYTNGHSQQLADFGPEINAGASISATVNGGQLSNGQVVEWANVGKE